MAERPLSSKRAISSPRIILGANLILSYFLPPIDPGRTIFKVIDLVLAGSAHLVLPEEVIDEIMLVVRTKSYFRQRMTEQDARGAIERLGAEADIPTRLADVPGVARDPKDDYRSRTPSSGALTSWSPVIVICWRSMARSTLCGS